MHLLALALLGCDAPIYYPDMGSNGLIWDGGDLSGDTAEDPGSGTGGTVTDPGASEVTALAPGDPLPCADGEQWTSVTFLVTNAADFGFSVYAIDATCDETHYSAAAPGQVVLINSEIGAGWVIRNEDSGEPIYGIIVGASGGSLVVE